MGNRTGRDSLGMHKREIYEELDVQEKERNSCFSVKMRIPDKIM